MSYITDARYNHEVVTAMFTIVFFNIVLGHGRTPGFCGTPFEKHWVKVFSGVIKSTRVINAKRV